MTQDLLFFHCFFSLATPHPYFLPSLLSNSFTHELCLFDKSQGFQHNQFLENTDSMRTMIA